MADGHEEVLAIGRKNQAMGTADVAVQDAGRGCFFEARASRSEADGGDAVGGLANQLNPVFAR